MYVRVLIAFAIGGFAGTQLPPYVVVQEPAPVIEAAPVSIALEAPNAVPPPAPPAETYATTSKPTQDPSPEPVGKAAVEKLLAKYAADLSKKQRAQLSSFALCESDYTQLNDDGSPFMSGWGTPDCGAFQINKVHWDSSAPSQNPVCTSLDANVQEAVQLFRESGSQPWDNSRECWAKKTPGW